MEPVERVHVEVDGVLGLVPQSWPPGPVHVAAVLPSSVLASRIGVGDELVKVNDANVCDLDRSALARELSRRPLSLEIKRFASLPRGVLFRDHRCSSGGLRWCRRLLPSRLEQ